MLGRARQRKKRCAGEAAEFDVDLVGSGELGSGGAHNARPAMTGAPPIMSMLIRARHAVMAWRRVSG